MKLRKSLIAGTAIAALSLTACAGGGSDDAGSGEETVSLRVTTPFGPESRHTIAIQEFADGVTERTDGSVEFEMFYQDALVPPPEIAEGLRSGTVDLAFTILSMTPDTFPVDNWIARAAFNGDPSPDAGTLQRSAAILEWATQDEAYLQDYEDAGIYPLLPRLLTFDNYGLYCDTPVTSLDDAQGLRVRVGGNAWAEEARALGMVPVSLPSTETYTSLQQGVIECFMGGLDDVDNLGLADLGGYYTPAGITGFDSVGVLLSDETWEQLSEEQQQIMQEEAGNYIEGWYGNYRNMVFEFLGEIEDGGSIEMVQAEDDLLNAVEEYQSDVMANLADQAPDSVEDPQGVLDTYMSTFDEWLDITEDAGHSTEDTSWVDFRERVDSQADPVTEWSQVVRERILQPYYESN